MTHPFGWMIAELFTPINGMNESSDEVKRARLQFIDHVYIAFLEALKDLHNIDRGFHPDNNGADYAVNGVTIPSQTAAMIDDFVDVISATYKALSDGDRIYTLPMEIWEAEDAAATVPPTDLDAAEVAYLTSKAIVDSDKSSMSGMTIDHDGVKRII
jgi:hypothetical protein